MMIHRHTKFGEKKMFGGLEVITWINTDILILRCDPNLECCNPIFSQDTLFYDDASSGQVWLPKNLQFRTYDRKSHILTIWTLIMTLALKIENIFFCV